MPRVLIEYVKNQRQRLVPEREARVLVVLKKATYVSHLPEQTPAAAGNPPEAAKPKRSTPKDMKAEGSGTPTRRTYRRRDLQAEE